MMSRNNPLWGAPRIRGELLKLDIEITEPTVAKIHAATSKTSIPDVAYIPGKPREESRFRGLFHGADHSISGTLCFLSAGA